MELNVHFVFLAPMNSMAVRIGGHTLHSWAEIPWQLDGPEGASVVVTGKGKASDVSTMSVKCASLRWIWIDEVEAVGATPSAWQNNM